MAARWNTVQCKLRVDDTGFKFRQGKLFCLLNKVKKTLRPTKPPKQWAHAPLYLRVKRRGVTLITHLPVVPRMRMSGAIPPFLLYVFTNYTNNLTLFIIHFLPTVNWNGQGLTEKLFPFLEIRLINQRLQDLCLRYGHNFGPIRKKCW
jgi:hypothetical protein